MGKWSGEWGRAGTGMRTGSDIGLGREMSTDRYRAGTGVGHRAGVGVGHGARAGVGHRAVPGAGAGAAAALGGLSRALPPLAERGTAAANGDGPCAPGLPQTPSRGGSGRFGRVRAGSEPFGCARTRLGSARFRSGRIGKVRLRSGSTRLCSAELGEDRGASARPGSARLGSARPARLSSASLSSSRFGSSGILSVRLRLTLSGSVRLGRPCPVAAAPGPVTLRPHSRSGPEPSRGNAPGGGGREGASILRRSVRSTTGTGGRGILARGSGQGAPGLTCPGWAVTVGTCGDSRDRATPHRDPGGQRPRDTL